MKILVMDEETVEVYSSNEHSETSVIISISSVRGRKAFIYDDVPRNNIKDILYLSFDDEDDFKTGHNLMTHLDAAQIIDFTTHWKNEGIDTLIVQCEYGESRSVAVAAALSEYFLNISLPEELTENMNKHCYNRLKLWLDRRREYDVRKEYNIRWEGKS